MAEIDQTPESRADPTFKLVTQYLAQAVGLKILTPELPQTTTADLVLELPDEFDEKLENSVFGFLQGYKYAVIEFKGQNDQFTPHKFLTNVVRTGLFCKQYADVPLDKVLNLFVCSRYPQEILDQARSKAGSPLFENKDKQPWLWHYSLFFQEIMIVVCRDLPLEAKYYDWLVFAPASTKKWRNFVKQALRDKRFDLVDTVRKLRPKEFTAMAIDVNEILRQLDPEERRRLDQDWADVIRVELPRISAENHEEASKFLAVLMNLLTPEERQKFIMENFLKALPAEEQTKIFIETSLKTLPTEERAKLFGDISLKVLPPEERKKLLLQLLDETEKEQKNPEQETE